MPKSAMVSLAPMRLSISMWIWRWRRCHGSTRRSLSYCCSSTTRRSLLPRPTPQIVAQSLAPSLFTRPRSRHLSLSTAHGERTRLKEHDAFAAQPNSCETSRPCLPPIGSVCRPFDPARATREDPQRPHHRPVACGVASTPRRHRFRRCSVDRVRVLLRVIERGCTCAR